MTELQALAQAIKWADHFIESSKVNKERIWCKKPLSKKDVTVIDQYNKSIARQTATKETLQKLYNKIQLAE
jgi:hypothetical protein